MWRSRYCECVPFHYYYYYFFFGKEETLFCTSWAPIYRINLCKLYIRFWTVWKKKVQTHRLSIARLMFWCGLLFQQCVFDLFLKIYRTPRFCMYHWTHVRIIIIIIIVLLCFYSYKCVFSRLIFGASIEHNKKDWCVLCFFLCMCFYVTLLNNNKVTYKIKRKTAKQNSGTNSWSIVTISGDF